MKTTPKSDNAAGSRRSPAPCSASWRFEVTRWDDLETVPQPPTEYGIRCRQGRGKWMHCGRDKKLLLFKTHNEANAERLKLIATKQLVQCGILGCGKSYEWKEMRTYRLGDEPLPCCPQCWESMGIPMDCTDVKDLRQNNEAQPRAKRVGL